ncbi:ABC transporter substrate-binding protein [Paramaledivibacter caminithermalis]|uniref:ABC-type nitrate/sulfonate/bicarbonate transport system, substrate-binding protein n=1 Tax=Paramaledivibacter caminithermalis (strain DSM 15212 / CIP 107654 / DViRD3) TaxID=1121301 RepID=A0A1M6QYN7_PARC5|nr:ABC transporter substrate-binding protein [Paramaledivibacter caminithermalis]SHK25273.1 ABC-type nitrate/sulfonate/bicarbonate transport system, substrate-binding protein [Paramaledivibacter caminithermalis DSM 15212]
MKRFGICLLVMVLLIGALSGCQSEKKPQTETEQPKQTEESKEEVQKVTFILDWLPNTNHTGIYTALEKGYFEEEGLEVEIVQPQEGDANALVGAGKGEFGVSFQEQVTMARTVKNNIPIKAIAAIIQHNTSGFASPVDKGIKSPKDFEGKKYGSWGTDLERAFLKTLMEKENADFQKLEILDLVNYDFFTSVTNDVDFQWIFYGWDGIAAEVKDFPINFIKLQDVDPKLDFYTPVIITNEDTIKNKPELVKKFLRAATKGYEFTIENPEQAVEYLLKHAPETDRDIALASQKYLAEEFKKDAERWGEMKLEVWETFGNWMFENGLLENKLDAKEAFTNEYLPEK